MSVSSQYRYEHVRGEIRRRITTGEYKEGKQIPSTRELAQSFGFPPVTVDKALRQLAEMGYIQREAKRGSFVNPASMWDSGESTESRTRMIGAIVFDSSSSWYWAKVIRGIEDALRQADYHLVIGNNDGDFDKASQYIDSLRKKGIEGFIIVPIGQTTPELYEENNKEILDRLEKMQVPFVLLDRYLASKRYSVVASDNYGDACRLVEHLLQAGSRSPICISHYHMSTTAERERAFIDVLRRHGYEDAAERVYHLDAHRRYPRQDEDVRQILRGSPAADGVFAINSAILTSSLKVCTTELTNRHILHVNYDEPLGLERSGLLVASAIQPAQEMGLATGKLMLEHLEDPGKGAVQVFLRSEIQLYG